MGASDVDAVMRIRILLPVGPLPDFIAGPLTREFVTMTTIPKDSKFAGISASSPERREVMDRLIASLKTVKVSLSLRPSR